MLLCRNVNTLQRSQKTMTPRGEEGVRVCAQCVFVCAHVLLCGWVQQQHYRERKENDGGEMSGVERNGEREKVREGEPTLAKLEI